MCIRGGMVATCVTHMVATCVTHDLVATCVTHMVATCVTHDLSTHICMYHVALRFPCQKCCAGCHSIISSDGSSRTCSFSCDAPQAVDQGSAACSIKHRQSHTICTAASSVCGSWTPSSRSGSRCQGNASTCGLSGALLSSRKEGKKAANAHEFIREQREARRMAQRCGCCREKPHCLGPMSCTVLYPT